MIDNLFKVVYEDRNCSELNQGEDEVLYAIKKSGT